MSNKILKIEEVFDVVINKQAYDGYHIVTERNEIYFVIDNYQQCCEDWGTKYLSTADDLSEYVGSEYIGYDTDEKAELNKLSQFLNIHTSNGDISFVVYNDHNGYYSHAVLLVVDEEIKNETSI